MPEWIKTENCTFHRYLPEILSNFLPVIPYMWCYFRCVLCARAPAPISLYVVPIPMNVPERDSTRKFNRGPRQVTPQDTTRPYLVRLQELHTMLYTLNDHYPYHSIYPHPWWDDSKYNYACLIRLGPLWLRPLCGHSAIPEINSSGVSVGWRKEM